MEIVSKGNKNNNKLYIIINHIKCRISTYAEMQFDTLTPKGMKWGWEAGILRVKRHEGVGYSLLGSDTVVCGISVEGKSGVTAES